ncbi:Ger(x)C family spore germination protein [Paenibacillus lactis]|uniref:Spore germination protein KC n=1 Tax=Paenibacillus lactis TaxID=228574 RepID=A0ABS4FI28_9BACL|nr:Ger(x)C family spore germination protein [Paenibacillus lactis]MBP1895918.1 spore germination protein KC [Paenibacillus lactis]
MDRNRIIPIVMLIFLLLLSGCWDSNELNSLSFVAATAIDRDEDRKQWVISFQVVIPQAIATQTGGGAGGSQSPVTIFSTRGRTIREAMQNASLETSRTLFFGHNSVLIMNEGVARTEGVKQMLDFFLRPIESRETMSVLLTKGKASDLLEVFIPLEKINGNAIQRVIEQSHDKLSQVQNIKLIDFATMVADPNSDAKVPEVRISGNKQSQSSLDALKSTRSKAVIKLGDLGVFRHDKLIGWMNRRESRGVAWLSNEVSQMIIVFPCDERNPDQLSSFAVIKSSTELDPKVHADGIVMDVRVKAEGVLDEMSCPMKLKDPDVIKVLERAIEDEIKEEIQAAWSKMRELNADVAGIRNVIHRKQPVAWRKLSQSKQPLEQIEIRMHVKASIENTNMLYQPFSNMLEPKQ